MGEGDLETLTRIAALVEALDRLPEAAGREQARQLLQAVLDVHHRGLARVLDLVRARADAADFLDELAGDRAVALLLALHDLHPRGLDVRVRDALDELRPQLGAEGVAVELVAIAEHTVRVRVFREGPRAVVTTPSAVRAALEGAIAAAAPEIAAVEVDGLDERDLVPLGKRPSTLD